MPHSIDLAACVCYTVNVESIPLIVYHVTDNPNFRVDYSHRPFDMFGVAGGKPALFATTDIDRRFWEGINCYRWGRAAYVVVLEIDNTRDDAIEQGRWFSGEVIITDMTAVRVVRMIECDPCDVDDVRGWGVECSGFKNPWGGYCGLCGS